MKPRIDRAVIVALVTLAVDLITKRLAFGDGTGGPTAVALGVEIDPARNKGIAFSMLEGRTLLIFILMATAIAVLTTFYLRHRDRPGLWLATGLMLGAAAGNAIDRVSLGYVRDFVAIGSWPTFNVADAALAFGVVVLIVTQWRGASEEEQSERDAEHPDIA